ncbi:MAG: Histidinol dehydrogenase [Gemmatimonadetes bacterium]|nr:Histidinol dehydrogenase [Gemmatimonadota bacterium]
MSAADFLRFTGSLDLLTSSDRNALYHRAPGGDPAVAAESARIIADVRARGDAALRDMARRFDRVELEALEIPRAALGRALDSMPKPLRQAMERAARNIATVHRAFAPTAMETSPAPGIVVGRRPDALRSVGVYAPGGRASYPSSVLMGAIPARVAGVSEIILCSPPDRAGSPPAAVLAAAAIAEVDRVFAVGGAGAIAAMALGTESIPRVDRIVGPGNAFVASAKLQLVDSVAIDSPAGPSELVVVADEHADPSAVASEMVAQAEHDPSACVVAVVLSESAAGRLEQALRAAAASAQRQQVVCAALAAQGGILVAATLRAAIEFANAYAPEHLLLAVCDPDALLPLVRNAGTVFLGETSSVTFGDYMTGANHVLPTGGSARAYSGLSPLDFVRWTTYQRIDPHAARSLADDVGRFADAESLPAHAAAARRLGVTA